MDYADVTNVDYGVSPALNVNLASVLFASEIDSEPGSYKLTILDNAMTVNLDQSKVIRDGSKMTVPFTLEGTNAGNMTQMSIVMTEEPWSDTDGWAENGSKAKYYGKMTQNPTDNTWGFTLPDFYDPDWYVYLLAEDVNEDKATDYASAPVEILIPFDLVYEANGGKGTMDPGDVFVDAMYEFPECGFEPTGKTKFSHWTISGDNGTYAPDEEIQVLAKYIIDDVFTVTANWEDLPPAEITTKPAAKDLTYTGTAQELISKGVAEHGTMMYALGENAETEPDSGWIEDIPTGLKAGTFHVWYKAEGDQDHNDSKAGCITAEIGQAPLTITANPRTIIYGSAPKNSGVVYEGFVNQETEETAGLTGTLEFDYDYAQYGDAGTYTITPKGLSAKNYEITFADGTLTVEPKETELFWADTKFTYNGTEQAPEATAVDIVNNDIISVTVTGATDAGMQTATATGFTGEKAGNYKLPADHTTKFRIKQKTVTIIAQDKAFAYDGTAQSWGKYDVDGLVGDDEITATVTGSITYPKESPVNNVIESYVFTKGNPANYIVITEDGTLTMTNAKVAITITAASQEWAYDGSTHSNSAVTVTEGSLISGNTLVATATGSVTNVADTKTGNNPIAEGYKVMHGDKDVTANYAITLVAGTLTIRKADQTAPKAPKADARSATNITLVSLENGQYSKDGTTWQDEATFTGLSPEHEYTFYQKLAADENHNESPASSPAKISTNSHVHHWKYTATDTTITATCGNDDGGHSGEMSANVTIIQPKHTVYNDGKSEKATITGSIDGTDLPAIVYKQGTKTLDGAPKAAGTYTASITLGKATASVEYTVEEASAAVKTAPKAVEGLIYNGEVQKLVTKGTATGGTMQYALGNKKEATDEYTTSIPAETDAGTYYVWYITKGDANHDDTEAACIPVTIGKAKATITADAKTKVYGDADPEWTAVVTGEIGKDKLNYSLSSTTGENAGEYDISVKLGDNPNYDVTATAGKLTITQKSIADAAITLNRTQLTYSGAEQGVQVTGVSVDGMTLSTKNYTATGLKGTDKGEYTVTVTGKGNFTDSATAKWQIVDKAMTVSADNINTTYDGTAYGITVEITDPASGAAVRYGKTAGTYDLDESPTIRDAGTLTVYYKVTAPNYTDYTGVATVTIAKAKATVTADAKTKVYGAEDPELTATVTGAAGNEKLHYTLSRTAGENVGKHTITVIPGDNPNYDVKVTDGALTITKAHATVTADAKTKTYGDADPEWTAVVTGTVGEEKLHYVLYRTAGENVGEYKITVTAGENPNYRVTTTDGKLTITKAAAKVTADAKTKVYGTADPELTATVTGAVEDEALHYTLARAKGEDTGTYAVTVTPGENPNYDVTAADGKLTITKAAATVTADAKTKVYGAKDPALTATVSGTLGSDTLDYKIERAAGEDAGEYAITITPGKNGNYDVTAVDGTFVIEAKQMTAVAENVNAEHDGEAHGITVKVSDPASSATVSYGTKEGKYDLTASPTIKEVGTKTVYYKVTAANYVDFTGSATITVTQMNRELTIHYVYPDGAEAAETYHGSVQKGKNYAVTSPKITGYTADPAKVSGEMGTEDIIRTVVYRAAVSSAAGLDYHATLLPDEQDDTVLWLKWKGIDGAKGYRIFFSLCDGDNVQEYDTVSGSKSVNSYEFKGLEKGKPYKAKVQALDNDGETIGKASFLLHASAGGSLTKSTDAKSVTAEQETLVLGTGKTFQLTATAKGYTALPLLNHTGEELSWYSSNSNVAKVDNEGTVTAVAPGSCTIYVLANNGVEDAVKVIVGAYDLVLPASMKTVSESAMEGIAAKGVYVGDQCTKIQKRAFADCESLTMIRLPMDCTIVTGAFDGCGKLKTVVAPAGGMTEEWARENGLVFVAE